MVVLRDVSTHIFSFGSFFPNCFDFLFESLVFFSNLFNDLVLILLRDSELLYFVSIIQQFRVQTCILNYVIFL